MKWNDLSDPSKTVLEWLEGIHVEMHHNIVVKVGERPEIDGKCIAHLKEEISQDTWDEIKSYAISGKDGKINFLTDGKMLILSLDPLEEPEVERVSP